MRDAIVIGSGIMGATIGAALRTKGMDVMILDDRRPMSGTFPSGGHLRPAWFGKMSKEQYLPAMDLLDKTWGMSSEEYLETPSNKKTVMHRVDTDKVLASEFMSRTVLEIGHLNNYPSVSLAYREEAERCRLLVVAAGVWCQELLGKAPMCVFKQGVSFRVLGTTDNIIHTWAPYKQVVTHQQQSDKFWIGDGTAIIAKNWTEQREEASRQRCSAAVRRPFPKSIEVRTGYRPYVKHADDVPCLLEQITPRCWLATGAGKSGTISAGWAATQILASLDK